MSPKIGVPVILLGLRDILHRRSCDLLGFGSSQIHSQRPQIGDGRSRRRWTHLHHVSGRLQVAAHQLVLGILLLFRAVSFGARLSV